MAAQPKISSFNIHLLNNFCKNKKGIYELISNSLGFFLPKLQSRAITQDFLMKALKKEIFMMERKDVRPAPSLKEKASSADLFEEINKLLQGKSLGFGYENLADKEWLCDVLYSLKQDHPFFSMNSEFAVTREFEEG